MSSKEETVDQGTSIIENQIFCKCLEKKMLLAGISVLTRLSLPSLEPLSLNVNRRKTDIRTIAIPRKILENTLVTCLLKELLNDEIDPFQNSGGNPVHIVPCEAVVTSVPHFHMCMRGWAFSTFRDEKKVEHQSNVTLDPKVSCKRLSIDAVGALHKLLNIEEPV